MRFDEYWDDAGQAGNENDRPLPPDGRATGTITEVTVGREAWAKHDRNPDGDCIKAKIGIGQQWRPLTVSIPLHWRGLLIDLCKSARVRPPERGVEWDERALVGKVVIADITRAVSNRGTEYCRVERYVEQGSLPPAPTERPPESAVPGKRRAPVAPAGGEDDVPFLWILPFMLAAACFGGLA